MTAAIVGAGCGASKSQKVAAASHGGPAATAAPTDSGDTPLERAADHGRVEGSDTAPLWVVEVSDFQCPYCRQWHAESYEAIKKAYVDTGKIRFAYINFPLSIHRNAWPAAEAAMCASAQGKFWPMHDSLFAEQERWGEAADPRPILDSLAATVGVDPGTYHDCVTQHKLRALIQADIDRATESGVKATPSFLIGGQVIEGAQPLGIFREAIDEALQRATKKS